MQILSKSYKVTIGDCKSRCSSTPTWSADVGTRTCFQRLSSTTGKFWRQRAQNFHSCQEQREKCTMVQSIMIALDQFGFLEFDQFFCFSMDTKASFFQTVIVGRSLCCWIQFQQRSENIPLNNDKTLNKWTSNNYGSLPVT